MKDIYTHLQYQCNHVNGNKILDGMIDRVLISQHDGIHKAPN